MYGSQTIEGRITLVENFGGRLRIGIETPKGLEYSVFPGVELGSDFAAIPYIASLKGYEATLVENRSMTPRWEASRTDLALVVSEGPLAGLRFEGYFRRSGMKEDEGTDYSGRDVPISA